MHYISLALLTMGLTSIFLNMHVVGAVLLIGSFLMLGCDTHASE